MLLTWAYARWYLAVTWTRRGRSGPQEGARPGPAQRPGLLAGRARGGGFRPSRTACTALLVPADATVRPEGLAGCGNRAARRIRRL